jgi:superfamily II DNA or RNA helicase
MALTKAVVAWLTRKSAAARPTAASATAVPAPRPTPTPGAKPVKAAGTRIAAPSLLGLGMARSDMTKWAGADRLRSIVRNFTLGELVVPAEVANLSRGYLPMHDRLESLLIKGGVSSYYSIPPALLQHVLGLFQLAERGAEAALEEDRALLAAPALEDAELEELRQKLLNLRETIRPSADPRPSQLRRTEVTAVDLAAKTLQVQDRDGHEFCSHHHWVPVEIGFAEGLARIKGSPPCKNQCAVALAAVDAAIQWLSQAKPSKTAKTLAHVVAVPAWQLAVEKLDEVLAAHGKAEHLVEQQDLGWRLNLEFLGRELEPVWVGSNRKGEQRIKKANLKDLRSNLQLCRRPGDQKLVELLRPQVGQAAQMAGAQDAYRLLGRALALLAGHPHLFLADGDEPLSIELHPLELRLVESKDGANWQMQLGPLTLALAAVKDRLALSPDHAWFWAQRGVLVVAAVSPSQLALLGALDHAEFVPASALPQVLQRVPQLSRLLAVVVPDRLRGQKRPALHQVVLRLDALPDGSLAIEPLVRPLENGPLLVPGAGPAHVYAQVDTGRIWTERDLAKERGTLKQLWLDAGLSVEEASAPRTLAAEQGLDLLALLSAREDQVEVLWAKARRQVRHAGVKNLRVEIKDRPDWFGVAGAVEVDGAAVDLAAVLEAIRGRKKYVKVSGDVWLQLSDALRAHLEPVADAVVAGKDGLIVSPLQAGALAEVVEAPQSSRWQHSVERMRQSHGLKGEVPSGLCAQLRSYQSEGYAWLERLAHWSPGALLADDMGLGKTLQALALLLHRRDLGPALVVAPTSVESNWLREAERFAPGLRFSAWRSGDRADHGRVGPGDVLVISYDLLVRDVTPLSTVAWSTLVLDEAQSVKNATTQRWKAVTRLQADFRLGLTGTPVENHIGELWAVVAATVPGLLGPWPLFQQRYGVAIERDGKSDSLQSLIRVLKPFMLRRLKSEVARDLPARLEIRVDVEPSAAERELYEQVRLASLAEIHGGPADTPQQQRFAVLAAITRLRQVACHPRLFDEHSAIPSAKLEHVSDLLVELKEEGHRALVFSQFVRHLSLLRERLEQLGIAYRYLDGSTPEPQRRKEVKAFQEGTDAVFLISLKAGGTGLNLTAADYVFHLDPWWNPAVEDQATDRAHRIGQQRPVTVYRLVAKGTIEEAILDLQAQKRDLVASLLSGSGESTQLSTEELLGLLGEVSAGTPAAVATRKKPVAKLSR